jgi:hypothetical protein
MDEYIDYFLKVIDFNEKLLQSMLILTKSLACDARFVNFSYF